jgi:hypothetical protein
MIKRFSLGVLAYLVPTFALGFSKRPLALWRPKSSLPNSTRDDAFRGAPNAMWPGIPVRIRVR